MSNNSMVDAFGTPVVISVQGKEVRFPVLSCNEVAHFVATLKARNIETALKFADECKLVGMERFKTLKAHEDYEPIIQDIWQHANTPKGAQEICVKSLMKTGKSKEEADVVLENVNPFDAVKIAMFVSGAPKEEAKPETKPDPNAQEGYPRN